MHLLHTTMSLVSLWSKNFCLLKNNMTSFHSFKPLKLGSYCISQRVFNSTGWNFQPLTTEVQAGDRKPQRRKACEIRLRVLDERVRRSTKSEASKQALRDYKIVGYCDIQQKSGGDNKDSGQAVTVLVFDVETTGFSRNRDRIVEVAIQDLHGGNNSTFQTLVNPERSVPNAHIHGISTHMVNRPDIPRWKDLVPILLQYVQSRQIDGGPVLLVSHNGRCFDVPFIVKEFGRCSFEIPPDWLFLDTLPLARQLVKPDGRKLSLWNLQALRKHYGIPLVGTAHGAMSDVKALSLVFQRITFDLKLTVTALLDRSFQVSRLAQVPN